MPHVLHYWYGRRGLNPGMTMSNLVASGSVKMGSPETSHPAPRCHRGVLAYQPPQLIAQHNDTGYSLPAPSQVHPHPHPELHQRTHAPCLAAGSLRMSHAPNEELEMKNARWVGTGDAITNDRRIGCTFALNHLTVGGRLARPTHEIKVCRGVARRGRPLSCIS